MRCEEARSLLQDYVEGELPAQVREKVLTHLQACASCESEVKRYTHLFGVLGSQPIAAPPEEFADHVMRKVGAARALSLRLKMVKFLAAAACLVLAVFIGYRVAYQSAPSGAPPTRISRTDIVTPDMGVALGGLLDLFSESFSPLSDCSRDIVAGVEWLAAPVTAYVNETLGLEAEESHERSLG